MSHPLSNTPDFSAKMETLSYMAVDKLRRALDVRDSRTTSTFSQAARDAQFRALTEEAEALVAVVGWLGTDEQHYELCERMRHTRETHELYLESEREVKALRKARKAEGRFRTCPKCQFTYNKAGVVVASPGAGHAACQSHLTEDVR